MANALFEDNMFEATFSPCRQYRYVLQRRWAEGTLCCFCMLNPSTADEFRSDPTVTRCINFAKAFGHGGLVVVNLFAYRSTDPDNLRCCVDPVGPANDRHIIEQAHKCARVIAAWGCHGAYQGRGAAVHDMIRKHVAWREVSVLKLTKDGWPSHPLYLKANLRPYVMPYSA